MNEIKQQASALLSTIDSPVIKGHVQKVQSLDPTEELRREVLEFFKNRIASIKRSEELKELVYTELQTKIQGGELTFDQLMGVLARLDHGANDSADSIISMFRPNNNGTSMLTEIVQSRGDNSDLARAFANYSSEDLQAIEKTMHTLRAITEKSSEKPISKEEDTEEL